MGWTGKEYARFYPRRIVSKHEVCGRKKFSLLCSMCEPIFSEGKPKLERRKISTGEIGIGKRPISLLSNLFGKHLRVECFMSNTKYNLDGKGFFFFLVTSLSDVKKSYFLGGSWKDSTPSLLFLPRYGSLFFSWCTRRFQKYGIESRNLLWSSKWWNDCCDIFRTGF